MRGWRALALIALLFTAASAFAASDAAVDTYIDKSGLAAQLTGVERGVLAGLDAAHAQSPSSRLGDDAMAQLRAAVHAAFDGARLRRTVRAHLITTLSEADAAEALRWLDTPFGKRVSVMEAEGSTPEAFDQAMQTGAATLAAQSAARAAELERLLKASGSVDVFATITLNQQIGIMRGMALAAGMPDPTAGADARARLDTYRGRMAATLAPKLLATAAVLYAPLTDRELRDYADELEKPESLRVTKAVGEALDKALLAAAVDLGRRIGGAVSAPPTTT